MARWAAMTGTGRWVRPYYWQTLFLLASSAPRHACRIFNVGPGIADEHISIRHLDRAQRLGVEGRLCRQQAVQMENVSRDRINVFATWRLRRVLRHGAADIIE